jgi:quinol monooxygenase YgiN
MSLPTTSIHDEAQNWVEVPTVAATEWPAVPMPRFDPASSLDPITPNGGVLNKEAVMPAPFIFIGTHKVKPGKLEEFQAWFSDYCDTTVEPNEPRLLSFNAYTNPDANEVTVVQVHADAESMVHHMSVITEHVGRAYADFLEMESRWQVYGTPRAGVLELIQQMGGSEQPVTSQEPFAGFTRLRETTGATVR